MIVVTRTRICHHAGYRQNLLRLQDELAEAEKVKTEELRKLKEMKIKKLQRQKAEAEEQIRLQREQIKKHERELSQLQEEHEAENEGREEEWQGIQKELKRQQDQLRLLTDLLQSNQRRQLSEALGLPEEQPSEVLEAYVTSEKGKVAITETHAFVTRQEHLTEYQMQARDLAGRLLNYEDLLQSHMIALKNRKVALEELESCGEKYTKELTECDQQLEQLREKLGLAQARLKSCKEKLQEYREKFEECLDEMNECEGTLSLSLLELKHCLDRLEKLREKLTVELSSLDQTFQRGKNLIGKLFRNASRWLGYSDDHLEEKKAELQKCSKELEATEGTLERLKKTLQDFEMELGKLKECIKKAKDPHPTDTIATSHTQSRQASFFKLVLTVR